MANLLDGLFEEMNRVRDLITEYKKLPDGVGMIGAMLMEHDIQVAEEAIKESDVVKMIRAFEALKGCTG